MADRWIVMTSSAHVRGKARRFGRYRNVALVKLTRDYADAGRRPAMISKRAAGVVNLVELGTYSVGTTERCAYRRALAEAEAETRRLNELESN